MEDFLQIFMHLNSLVLLTFYQTLQKIILFAFLHHVNVFPLSMQLHRRLPL